jgi:predicted Holliday junction resolvase-like endonuclease
MLIESIPEFMIWFFVLAVIALGLYVLILRARLKTKETEWRLKYRDEIYEDEKKRAEDQLQKWRDVELTNIKSQIRENLLQKAKLAIQQWKNKYESNIRRDAIARSGATTAGKIAEQFVPFLPDFGFNPKDAKFIGQPVDFIVFDGLSDKEIRQVVFIEIKTGQSTLTKRERQIRNAIVEKKILWKEIRL